MKGLKRQGKKKYRVKKNKEEKKKRKRKKKRIRWGQESKKYSVKLYYIQDFYTGKEGQTEPTYIPLAEQDELFCPTSS